ncbi:MAG: hypothetical protein KatS3mg105_1288 [Gemmatales bacterium]|nr:MAG: hypothetical protein KatS3mg105_1288 [Gemmatales bacterium]
MKRVVVLSCAVACSAFLLSATAQEKNAPPAFEPSMFLQFSAEDIVKFLDKNDDKMLERSEVPPIVARYFAQLDKDKNNKLDAKELDRLLAFVKKQQETAEKKVDAVIKQLDRNNDGQIQRNEAARTPFAKTFQLIDRNGDGVMDRNELLVAAGGIAVAPVEVVDKRPGATPPTGTTNPAPKGKPALKDFPFFETLDANLDGHVVPAELGRSPLLYYFKEIDANKDGKITGEEYSEFIKKYKKQ